MHAIQATAHVAVEVGRIGFDAIGLRGGLAGRHLHSELGGGFTLGLLGGEGAGSDQERSGNKNGLHGSFPFDCELISTDLTSGRAGGSPFRSVWPLTTG